MRGSITKDISGYRYHYDNENRAAKIKKTNDTVDVAIYTCDALGRRIGKIGGAEETRISNFEGVESLGQTSKVGA